jgi:hypothetical protein
MVRGRVGASRDRHGERDEALDHSTTLAGRHRPSEIVAYYLDGQLHIVVTLEDADHPGRCRGQATRPRWVGKDSELARCFVRGRGGPCRVRPRPL